MKQPSKAQKWAQERNFEKWRLRGIIQTLENISGGIVLTQREHSDFARAILNLRATLIKWDTSNKESKEHYFGKA